MPTASVLVISPLDSDAKCMTTADRMSSSPKEAPPGGCRAGIALLGLLLLLADAALSPVLAAAYGPVTNLAPPKPPREMRGAWVATVDNAVWPSKRGLSTAEQKRELVAILDRAARLKLNAILFQVRPECDAVYASQIEPWSEFLSGVMGRAPEPFYDPLAFAVEEAHQRGLELHAWFNPYRALDKSSKSPVATNHISRTRPDLVRRYGEYLWLDPGDPEVQIRSLRVVMDVVRRYDIDAVHFDDYFYPYPKRGALLRGMDFPDETTWKRFGAQAAQRGLGRDDWRRENVDTFIQRVCEAIHTAKPWVKFGISPFGIWRPGHPAQIRGMDAYAQLYADSRKWLASGWLDYCAPQLYWPIGAPDQSFPALLAWWSGQNTKGRLLCPGMNSSALAPDEIARQIQITRSQPGVTGHIHWNLNSLAGSNGLAAVLRREIYTQPALVPATPWLESTPPAKPVLSASTNNRPGLQIRWAPTGNEPARWWLLQSLSAGTWTTEILPEASRTRVFEVPAPDAIALRAVDRNGNVSPPAQLAAKPSPPGPTGEATKLNSPTTVRPGRGARQIHSPKDASSRF